MRRYNVDDLAAAAVAMQERDAAVQAARDAGAEPGDGSPEDLRACAAVEAWQAAVIAANEGADRNEREAREAEEFDRMLPC